MRIGKEEFIEYKDTLEGHSLSTLWYVTPPEKYSEKNFTFDQRKEFFLLLLRMLLEDGKIKLAAHGSFLDGSFDEQITRFREALPATEEDLIHGLWFTFEECPGGIVWIHDDGYQDWT
ncbi:DUF596 domain-containing protein [Serratia sp. TSA_198.1]|jgi:hypothetical protein|uniref:DUF596 domain-containing protein n=1 Tax=Serratia sp. TSA_198.1 TaxID=3415664 RepID=UPI004045FC09